MLILDQELTPELLKVNVQLSSKQTIQVQIEDAALSAVGVTGTTYYLTESECLEFLKLVGYPFSSISGRRDTPNAEYYIH